MQKDINPATEFSAAIAEHESPPRRRYNEAGARARLNQALYTIDDDSRRLRAVLMERKQKVQDVKRAS